MRISHQEGTHTVEHSARALLLHPMARTFDEMSAPHVGTGAILHRFETAGHLIDAPIAFAGDEHRRHVDRAAGKKIEFLVETAGEIAAVPLQPALEARARE